MTTTESMKINLKFPIKQKIFLIPRRSANITVMICVIISLIGVRLNKPYSVRVPMDIPVFTGTHADFLVIVSIFCVTQKSYICLFF